MAGNLEPSGLIGRVSRGYRVAPGSAPWQVMLYYIGNARLSARWTRDFCGGVLLTDDLVITAAHCLEGLNSSFRSNRQPSLNMTRDVIIRLGKHNRTVTEVTEVNRTIGEYTPHPDFDAGSFAYDIAVIRLGARVDFTPAILPVCIDTPPRPGMPSLASAGRMATVTGWGNIRMRGPKPAVLQGGTVPLQPRQVCANASSYPVADSILCAGEGLQNTADACDGDSGGPLVLRHNRRWFLVGLVSYGEGTCSGRGKYGYYTNVTNSAVNTWIRGYSRIL